MNRAFLGELINRIAAVHEHALIAVDVGNLAFAAGRGRESRVIGKRAGFGVQRPDVHDVGPHCTRAGFQFEGFPIAGILQCEVFGTHIIGSAPLEAHGNIACVLTARFIRSPEIERSFYDHNEPGITSHAHTELRAHQPKRGGAIIGDRAIPAQSVVSRNVARHVAKRPTGRVTCCIYDGTCRPGRPYQRSFADRCRTDDKTNKRRYAAHRSAWIWS